jgi:hypothetical protein
MRRTPILLLGIALLALALPARGDIAVQLEGELTAGALSPESQAAVDDFFANDPRDPSNFACFEGDLVDFRTNRVVGIGVDCLWVTGAPADPSPGVATIDDGEGNQIAISPQIDAVTFFFLPGGHLVSDGLTTVRPFFVGIGDGDGQVTHLTGSVPGATPTIVAGSGRFLRMVDRASVRLSGAVNTSKLFTEGKIDFRCIFVIETGP